MCVLKRAKNAYVRPYVRPDAAENAYVRLYVCRDADRKAYVRGDGILKIRMCVSRAPWR